jgi:hypothetical protein
MSTRKEHDMSEDIRDQVIDDLLQKRPKGPIGVDVTYTEAEYYDYDRERYRTIQKPDHPNYGYTDGALFSLILHEEYDVRQYVLKRWFSERSNVPQSTVTRRSRRIWERIKSSVRKLKEEGGRGIYKVTPRYSDNVLTHIFARDNEEALILYKTFFPKSDQTLKTTFLEFGDAELLLKRNGAVRENMSDQIMRLQNEVKRCQKKIERLTTHTQTITMLEGHQVAVETTG